MRKGSVFKHKNLIFLFLLPSLLGMTVFYIAPFFLSVYYMLIDNIGSRKFAGAANLIDTWGNEAFSLAARNTLIFMSVNIPLGMVLALALSLMLKALPLPARRLLAIFFLLPLVIPSGSIAFFWKQLLAVNGMLNRYWVSSFSEPPVDWLNSNFAMAYMVLIFLWKNTGFNLILFQAGLDFIPKEYYEYATVEGAGKIRRFFTVTVTCLQPTFLLAFVMSAVNSFKVFREVYMLTGTHPDNSIYLLQHFINNQFSYLNYQRMSSASFFIFASVFMALSVLYRLQQRQSYL
jgi:multiple sugar transport system permease protein